MINIKYLTPESRSDAKNLTQSTLIILYKTASKRASEGASVS